MAVQNLEGFYFNAADLVYAAYIYRLQEYLSGATNAAAALGNRYGYRTLQWSSTKGGNTNNYYLIFWNLASTELTQAGVLLGTPGWNQVVQVEYFTSGQPLQTWSLMRTFWQQNYVAFKQSLVDNWTTSFISAQTLHEISAASDRLRSATTSYQITTDTQTMVDVSTLSGGNGNLVAGNLGFGAPVPSVPSGPANLYVNSPAIQSMASSLSDIAMTDYEISLNHGQSIFSVRGKVTT